MTPTSLPVSPYGTFTGNLFQYSTLPSLVAFESQKIQPKKCILIGGLSDALIPVPYTQNIQQICNEIGWSLVQPTISSSGMGFGHGSLQRDTDEISLLMKYLIEHHHAEKFCIIGHSTGCQNAIHLTRYGESEVLEYLKGIVLQAPVSDREGAMVDNPEQYKLNINHARLLQEQGKEDEMMPRDSFWAPITAYRFLSLQGKGGDDDYFSSDFTDEELSVRLKHVSQCGEFFGLRALVAFSKEDEYVPNHVDKDLLLERLCSAMNTECNIHGREMVATPLMLENSNHNLSNDDNDKSIFVEAVKDLLININ